MNNSRIIEFYPYKLFECNNHKYLLASKTGGLFKIDEQVERLLEFEGAAINEAYNRFKEDSLEKEFEDTISTLEKLYVLRTEKNEEYFKIESSFKCNINFIELFVAQDCNLRCKYCYGDEGEYNDKGIMTLDTAKQAVKYLMSIAKKKEVSICFFGGEPLLNFVLIKEVVAYSTDLAKDYDKKVSFSITTNATLLNEEISNFFKEKEFNVTVSIDGDKEIHDTNRYYSKNKGSYDEVIKGINQLKSKDVKMVARATAEPKSMNMLKTMNHINKLGFRALYISPGINMFYENDEYKALKHEFNSLLEEFDQCLQEKDYKKIMFIKNLYKVLKRVHVGSMRKSFCGAMTNLVAIDKNGEIYPCHRFVSNKEYSIGNISDGIDMEIYENMAQQHLSLQARDNCSSCWASSLCGGGCPNENLLANNHPSKTIEKYCEINKDFIEGVILRYIQLSPEDKEILFKMKIS